MIRFPAAAAFCLLLASAGCGVGRYDADYAEAIERHRRGEPLRQPTRALAGEDQPSGADQSDAESGTASP